MIPVLIFIGVVLLFFIIGVYACCRIGGETDDRDEGNKK